MNFINILGAGMIVFPFVAFFFWVVASDGWRTALYVFGVFLGTLLFFTVGTVLLLLKLQPVAQ